MTSKTVETDLSKGVLHNSEWVHRWNVGNTRFHQPVYNKNLDDFDEKIFEGKKKSVFLPLCGKTLDLIWFYEHGHTVTGVEFVEQPARELFDEHKIEVEVTNVENVGKLYKSKDGRLNIYVADIYDISSDVCGQHDVIYDCRAMTAINLADRAQYVSLMLSLMNKNAVYLLYALEYDPTVWPGPPHTMSEQEVTDLYGDRCEIEKLLEEDNTNKDLNASPDSAAPGSDNAGEQKKPSSAGEAIKISPYVYNRWFYITLK